MNKKLQKDKQLIKEVLYKKLLDSNAFWSYEMSDRKDIPDRLLISETIIHLDVEEIIQLFNIFPKNEIKKVWREDLVIQGDYYYNLNRLMAWMFFDIKMPDRYIKATITNHFKKLESEWRD